jgi:hypothetical protein
MDEEAIEWIRREREKEIGEKKKRGKKEKGFFCCFICFVQLKKLFCQTVYQNIFSFIG